MGEEEEEEEEDGEIEKWGRAGVARGGEGREKNWTLDFGDLDFRFVSCLFGQNKTLE